MKSHVEKLVARHLLDPEDRRACVFSKLHLRQPDERDDRLGP
jgi:hypothetical protein